MGCVYQLLFSNGKSYVGMTTKNVQDRVARHLTLAKGRSKRLIYQAIRKHGEPEVRVLFEAEEIEELLAAEVSFIKELGTKEPAGYNLTAGGDGIREYEFPAEVRARMGRKFSSERRAQQSEMMRRVAPPGSELAKVRSARAGKTRQQQNPQRPLVIEALRKPGDVHELCQRTGLSRRDVESMIYRLRKEGYEITSTGRRGVLGKFVLVKEPDTNVP